MKKNILIIALSMFAQLTFAQKPLVESFKVAKSNSTTAKKQMPPSASADNDNVIFEKAETMPQFPGGPYKLLEYLAAEKKYPQDAISKGIQGRVIVSLVVNKDGSVTDVTAVRPVYPLLDKEAVRVVSSMPKWIPGTINGKAVRVRYYIPVTFRLIENK